MMIAHQGGEGMKRFAVCPMCVVDEQECGAFLRDGTDHGGKRAIEGHVAGLLPEAIGPCWDMWAERRQGLPRCCTQPGRLEQASARQAEDHVRW